MIPGPPLQQIQQELPPEQKVLIFIQPGVVFHHRPLWIKSTSTQDTDVVPLFVHMDHVKAKNQIRGRYLAVLFSEHIPQAPGKMQGTLQGQINNGLPWPIPSQIIFSLVDGKGECIAELR